MGDPFYWLSFIAWFGLEFRFSTLIFAMSIFLLYLFDLSDCSFNLSTVYFWILYNVFLCMLTVPIEMTILIKEHFNRWYSLKAYYFAMTVVDLPITVSVIYIYVSLPLELILSSSSTHHRSSVRPFSRSLYICGVISRWNGCASGCSLRSVSLWCLSARVLVL